MSDRRHRRILALCWVALPIAVVAMATLTHLLWSQS